MQIYSQVYSLKTVIEETPMPFAHWTQCRLATFLWVQTHVVNCPGENCPNAFTLRRATPGMRAHRACLGDFVPAADLFSRLSAFTDRQDAAGRATTARHPVRITAGVEPVPLGAARNSRRGQLGRMDTGRPAETCRLSWGITTGCVMWVHGLRSWFTSGSCSCNARRLQSINSKSIMAGRRSFISRSTCHVSGGISHWARMAGLTVCYLLRHGEHVLRGRVLAGRTP